MKFKELKKCWQESMMEAGICLETRCKPAIQKAMGNKKVASAVGAGLALTPLLSMTAFADGAGDIEGNINAAAEGVFSFIKGVVTAIAIAGLAACGLVLLLGLGGQRAAENAKAWMVRIAIGLMIIYMAEPLINWVKSVVGAGE